MEANIRTSSRKILEERRLVRQQAQTEAFQPFHVRALWGFEARGPEELSFQQGDIITVTEPIAGDWWKGQLRDRVGAFPSNYVEEISEDRLEEVYKERELQEEQRKRREMMEWMIKQQRETWERNLREEKEKESVSPNPAGPGDALDEEWKSAIAQLEAMGFQRGEISAALLAADGNVQRAAEYLANVSQYHKFRG
jgi:Variant SH3 domain/UBA/TS-N domain